MLHVLSYNVARKQQNLGYYEIGKIFIGKEEKVTLQPEEKLRLSGAITGKWFTHEWQQETKAVDFYVLKGILDELFARLNITATYKQAVINEMHPVVRLKCW